MKNYRDEIIVENNKTSAVGGKEKTTSILMNKFPKGMIEESDFKIVQVDFEQPLASEGDWIVIKLLQLSK